MSVLLLLSGGLDSIALAYWKRPEVALTIDYGQIPAEAEIRSASEVCRALNIRHEVIRADCSSLGSGDLSARPPLDIAPVPEWWPFRNQLLVTLAAMKAVQLRIDTLYIGTVSSDSMHADGTPVFMSALSETLRIQEGGLSLVAPAIAMSSVDLIKKSGIPVEILAWGHSCHVANFACGYCRGCNKHYEVMRELSVGPY